jgi:phosphoribosylcarboxyaminoimidazole (NCAIR) mutase
VIVMPTTAAGTQVIVVSAGCSAHTAGVLDRTTIPPQH